MITTAVVLVFLSVTMLIGAFASHMLWSPRRVAADRLREHRPTSPTAYDETIRVSAARANRSGRRSFWDRFRGAKQDSDDATNLSLSPDDPTFVLLLHAGFRTKRAARIFRLVRLFGGMGLAVLALIMTSGLFTEPSAKMMAAAGAGFVGYLGPKFWLRWAARRRQHRLRLSLPDALDLLVVCVEAGIGLNQAIVRVSDELAETHPEIAEEFRLVNLEIRAGRTRTEALRALGDRTGVDDIIALAAMIIQTEKFGTSIARSLRVHSDSLRVERRQRAEEAAAKTTIKLIFPLLFCIFPSLFVIIIGPAAMHLARIFGGGGQVNP